MEDYSLIELKSAYEEEFGVRLSTLKGAELKRGVPTGHITNLPGDKYLAYYLLNDVVILIPIVESFPLDSEVQKDQKWTFAVSLLDLLREVPELKAHMSLRLRKETLIMRT